jgi:hypothetical protein
MSQILAYDVESMGSDGRRDLLTVATTYSPEHQKIYQFAKSGPQGQVVKVDNFDALKEEFMQELDAAPILAGFNSVNFDSVFIGHAFSVPPERVMRWIMKSIDVFESCKRACMGRTFGLNAVLALNGFTVKIGSGMEAIYQAQRGEWKELGAYCQEDSKLTYEISTKKRIAIPEGFQWRKRNGGQTHDPSNILFMNVGPDHEISFEMGTLDQL